MYLLNPTPGRASLMQGVYTDLTAPDPYVETPLGLNPGFSFSSHACVTRSFGMSRSINFQIANSIGRRIHLYIFGDQVGDFRLGVSCPLRDCRTKNSGISGIVDFYERNKMSERVDPIIVTLAPGTTNAATMECYLTGLEMNMQNPLLNLADATLVFLQVPPGSSGSQNAPIAPTSPVVPTPQPPLTPTSGPPTPSPPEWPPFGPD